MNSIILSKSIFLKGTVTYVNHILNLLAPKKPCIHWLLRPKGFKKKHFKSLFNKYGYFQMEAFARWVANLVKAEYESEATYRFDTIVHAKPEQTISGDDIANLIEESKRTGVPFAKLAERLNADVQVIVKAGDAVPEIARRNPTKRNK